MNNRKSFIDEFTTFIKNNPVYLFCSLLYCILTSIMLGGTLSTFIFALILYGISMLIVFSPTGEKVLRFLERVRKLETKREKEYLIPIFQEVYNEAKNRNQNLGYIEICVIDSMSVNACAMGMGTIAVTKGAIETFSEDELKGILAHEISHIANLDTAASLYVIVGNGLFSIFVIIAKLMLVLIDVLLSVTTNSRFMHIIISIARAIFTLVIFIFSFFLQLALAVNSRANEYKADEFAYNIGYGSEITDAFYLLEKISLGDNSSVIERMLASHPRITARIERIESLIDRE